ncbi:MAG TPA: cellulase [Verrucomicrobiae bacterium]|nr:cellulase [Verrucomicrobiae bacterium]
MSRRLQLAAGLVTIILLGLDWVVPALALPAEPYNWHNVVIGGGGFVTGIITHPRQNGLRYARTDVGGVYRWDDSAERWVPITDWIGMADVNLTGCESVALDPNDPQRVYLAVGTYTWGKAAILRSADQGRTWQQTGVPFKMGGNETGRFNGERLAVDPNDGNILFFGSRRDGLWKSADRGATWEKVEGFPNTNPEREQDSNARPWFDFREQPVGIVCVLFDPSSGRAGNPTPVIYAAVSTSETNLYRSIDGGNVWQAVANQPVGLRPNHLARASDGMFYLSYGREPGPNSMTDGAVWKFNSKDGVWTDVTPIKPMNSDQPFGYGCVAVDAQHPSVVMATTFAHWHPHDQIFRSTNGGASWTPLWMTNEIVWDCSGAPYTETRAPHWMGTIVIDPFDSDRVLFTTGYGVWCCTNVTRTDAGQPTHWVFLDQGLEETVPLALISPPAGAHLISGVGDIDGFRHDDVNVSPADGSFSGPRFATTRDLVFAAGRPEIIVRIGNADKGVSVHIAISEDGGRRWTTLGSDPPGGGGGQGRIAVSADGRTILWALQDGSAFVTRDRGTTWKHCQGIASGVNVIADPVDASRFYAFDAPAGKLMVSTNSGLTFEAAAASFPVPPGGNHGSGVLAAMPGLPGDLWVGSRGLGLYHSTDGGGSFTRLNNVSGADALGFGKAAPGKTFPALYLLGSLNQLQAYYRSDDAGATWARINDDQHQYGSPDRPLVIGDPRIYGRVYFTTGGRGIIYGDPALNMP